MADAVAERVSLSTMRFSLLCKVLGVVADIGIEIQSCGLRTTACGGKISPRYTRLPITKPYAALRMLC